MDPPTPQIRARIRPSPVRRGLGILMLLALAGLLLWIAVAQPPAGAGWRLFLILLGAGALWLAERMRRATGLSIEMTDDEIRDSAGRVLARIDEITGIDRGVFAFKPSNGFMLKTARPLGRVWAPGLWWRLGRRVGVGGVTPAAEAKVMTELLTARLHETGRLR